MRRAVIGPSCRIGTRNRRPRIPSKSNDVKQHICHSTLSAGWRPGLPVMRKSHVQRLLGVATTAHHNQHDPKRQRREPAKTSKIVSYRDKNPPAGADGEVYIGGCPILVQREMPKRRRFIRRPQAVLHLP
jgi:hypothetical protein